jgi:hypothetical protein
MQRAVVGGTLVSLLLRLPWTQARNRDSFRLRQDFTPEQDGRGATSQEAGTGIHDSGQVATLG